MRLTWSYSEMKAIEDQYFQSGRARCPNDAARLKVSEIRAMGYSQTPIMVRCPRCGRNFQSSQLRDAERTMGFSADYAEIRHLASGGMGTVWEVEHRKSGKRRALKRIRPEFFRSTEMVERFRRETEILKRLQHPNIVETHEVYLDENGAAVAMELCSTSLDKLIGGPLDEQLSVFSDACAGLSYLHHEGVVHRDLKPHNILVDSAGRGKVSDFGLAMNVLRASTPLTVTGQAVGTPLYMAPEQYDDSKRVDERADLYAMGLVALDIYHGAIGRRPLSLIGVKAPLATTLSLVLSEDPNTRNISLHQLSEDLSATLAG